MPYIASTHIDLPPLLIHQLHNPCIVNQYTATNSVSICNAQTWLQTMSYEINQIDLRSILIHHLDNPCTVNHSSMHIKQTQIVLASAMHKHVYIQYHMHSIASTHIYLHP